MDDLKVFKKGNRVKRNSPIVAKFTFVVAFEDEYGMKENTFKQFLDEFETTQ